MRRYLWFLAVPIVLAFVWLVWPTPYRYEHVGHDSLIMVRVNRVTGSAEGLWVTGWYRLKR